MLSQHIDCRKNLNYLHSSLLLQLKLNEKGSWYLITKFVSAAVSLSLAYTSWAGEKYENLSGYLMKLKISSSTIYQNLWLIFDSFPF